MKSLNVNAFYENDPVTADVKTGQADLHKVLSAYFTVLSLTRRAIGCKPKRKIRMRDYKDFCAVRVTRCAAIVVRAY